MKFISYELRKLAGIRYIWIMLALMLIANALLCSWAVVDYGVDGDVVAEFFAMYREDPDTIEASYAELTALQAERNAAFQKAMQQGMYNYEMDPIPNRLELAERAGVSDTALYNELFSRIEQIESYPATMQRVIDRAKANLAEFSAMGLSENSYTYRYQERVIHLYEEVRDNVVIELENTRGWDGYFNYTAVNIFIFAFLVICGTVVFAQEQNSGFLPIIRTAKKGRAITAAAKIAAMMIITVLAVLLFTFSTWAVVGIKYGYSSSTNAIQAFEMFTLSPYILTVGEYFAITIAVKLATFLAFTSLVLLLGVLLSNYVLIYACGIGFFGVNFLLYTLSYINADNPFKNLNFVATAAVNPLFVRYRSVNLFGAVAGYVPFMAVFFTILFIGLSALTIWRFSTGVGIARQLPVTFAFKALREKIAHRPQRAASRVRRLRTHTRSLFAFECFKTLAASRFLLLAILLLTAKCYISSENYAPRSYYSDAVYKEYMTTLAGPVTDEKCTYIAEERALITSTLAKNAQVQNDYLTEKITFEEYRTYLEEYNYAYSRDELFRTIEEHLNYIECMAEQGIEAHFVYDTGWRQLFFTPFDYILFAAILIFFAGSFAGEYDSRSSQGGFSAILRSTGRGRGQTFAAKLTSCALISLVTSLVWNLADLIFIARAYDLPQLHSPIQSIQAFSTFTGEMSILQMLILVWVFRLAASLLLGLFVTALSCILRRTLPALSVTVAVTLFPALFDYFGLSFFASVDYTSFLRATPFVLLSAQGNGSLSHLILFALCSALITTAAEAAAAKKWIK